MPGMRMGGTPGIDTAGARRGGVKMPGTNTGLWWIDWVHANFAYASRSGADATHSSSRRMAAGRVPHRRPTPPGAGS